MHFDALVRQILVFSISYGWNVLFWYTLNGNIFNHHRLHPFHILIQPLAPTHRLQTESHVGHRSRFCRVRWTFNVLLFFPY
jgi:hypothetical protein